MMIFQPKTVSNALAQLGLQAARQRGIGADEFRRLTGISELETRQVNGRIAADRHVAMLNLLEPQWISGYLFDSELGTPVCAPLSTFLGVVTNAPTLAAALEHFLALRVLIGDVDDIVLRRDGDDFQCEYRLDGEGRGSISAFANLLLLSKLARQYTGDMQQTMTMELTGKAFSPLAQLAALGPFKVSFGQAANRLRFCAPLADRPYALHNPFSQAIVRHQADSDLRAIKAAHSFSLQLEERLTRLLRQQDPQASANPLELLCEQMTISRSGLHRRLQKETTNFQTILAGVRLAEAKRMLHQRQLAVADISDLLGFSSPSAFSRFFSERNGSTPSHYRRTQALLTA